jgi:ComF family protein
MTQPHEPSSERFSIRSAAVYITDLRRAILLLKYGHQAWMGAHLGLFLAQNFQRLFPGQSFDRIVPVPLHPRRLRERGFNQCVQLSRPLGRALGIPVDFQSVARVRHTPSQSASGFKERQRNLEGAFTVRSPTAVRGHSILVVDDVYTTGATLSALSTVLFRAGALRIGALTLARSPSAAAHLL